MRRSPWFPSLLLCLPIASLALAWTVRGGIVPARAGPGQALTVSSTADDGPGSLRRAIAAAADGDVISFDVTGDITLLRPLVIEKRVTIDGPGAELLALRGGERVRHFNVLPGADLALRGLTLADGVASDEPWNTPAPTDTPEPGLFPTPTVRQPPPRPTPLPFPTPTLVVGAGKRWPVASALRERYDPVSADQPPPRFTPTPTSPFIPSTDRAGGAILNHGALTVEDCVFEGNQAPDLGGRGGAIYNDRGLVVIRRSQFVRNRSPFFSGGDGGAIFNHEGPMTIVDSAFVGNVAANAGNAIMNLDARLVIVGSLFLQNIDQNPNRRTTSSGIASQLLESGELIIANSTLAHHTGVTNIGAVGLFNIGPATVVNSTFRDSFILFNRSAVVRQDRLTLINSILVSADGTANCSSESISDGGHNLQFPNASCSPSIPVADPLLTDWAQGSGPTLTISLAPGSPAIDAGDPEACADWPVLGLDARGLLRGGDGNGDGTRGCDIGAFEAGASITATPTQTATAGPSPTPSITLTPSITPTPSRTPTPTDGPSPAPTISSVPPPRVTPTRALGTFPPPITCTPPPCECGRLVGTCPNIRCVASCTATPHVPRGEVFLPISRRE